MKNCAILVTDATHSRVVVHPNSMLWIYSPTKTFEQKIVFPNILQVPLCGSALDKCTGL